MSMQDMFDVVLNILNEHNVVVGAGNNGQVDTDKFFANLKAYGAISEADLRKMSHEGISDCLDLAMKDGPSKWVAQIKPKALISKISAIFRKKENVDGDEAPNKHVSSKKASKMTDRELVECYCPEESKSSVGKRLKDLSGGQPFLVFESGRMIDVDASVKLLSELRQGYPPRKFVEVDGVPRAVHPLGYLPENMADENPFYHNRPLRPDGTCDQTNRSWEGIGIEIRQFIRLGMTTTKEIKIKEIKDAHDYLDLVLSEGSNEDRLKKLRQRFPNTSIKFDEAKERDELPKLKIVLGMPGKKQESKGGSKNPFDDGKQIQWMERNDNSYHPTSYTANNTNQWPQ